MKFYHYEKGSGKSFSPAEGGAQSFGEAFMRYLESSAILK